MIIQRPKRRSLERENKDKQWVLAKGSTKGKGLSSGRTTVDHTKNSGGSGNIPKGLIEPSNNEDAESGWKVVDRTGHRRRTDDANNLSGISRDTLVQPGRIPDNLQSKAPEHSRGTTVEPGEEYIKIVQVNLQHNKAATAIMAKGLKDGKFDIAIIQEPYIYKEAIRGLGGTNGIVYTGSSKDARTCVYIRNGMDAWPLQTYNFRDLTAVKIHVGKRAEKRALIVTSAYLPYEERDPVHQKLRDLIEHSKTQNLELIIGCDANSHHTVWGSSNINKRGEKLLDYLASSSLQIMNTGNRPTFVNRRRGEVIDITLASNYASSNIINWRVSDEITLSDHRYICFSYRGHHKIEVTCRRNPRNTVWDKYQMDLKVELGDAKGSLNSITDIEFEADNIERAINKAWASNCPEKSVMAKRSHGGLKNWQIYAKKQGLLLIGLPKQTILTGTIQC